MVKLLTSLCLLFAFTAPADAMRIRLQAETFDERIMPFPLGHAAPFPSIKIDAILTLTPVTGLYYQRRYGDYQLETNLVVTSLEGTMNGRPISLSGARGASWFTPALATLSFADSVGSYTIWWDGWVRLEGFPDPNNSLGFIPLSMRTTVIPDAVAVPDA